MQLYQIKPTFKPLTYSLLVNPGAPRVGRTARLPESRPASEQPRLDLLFHHRSQLLAGVHNELGSLSAVRIEKWPSRNPSVYGVVSEFGK
jgi:hypothetical protein